MLLQIIFPFISNRNLHIEQKTMYLESSTPSKHVYFAFNSEENIHFLLLMAVKKIKYPINKKLKIIYKISNVKLQKINVII